MEVEMTYGELKKRICAVLDLSSSGAVNISTSSMIEEALPGAVDAASRKIAAVLRCIVKRAVIQTSVEDGIYCAELPSDHLETRMVISNGNKCSFDNIAVCGGKIYSSEQLCEEICLFYYAYPASVSLMDDDAVLEFDDGTCDILTFGAAMELCATAYPGDYRRYSVLATEYDERMADALMHGSIGGGIVNSMFGKRRIGYGI